jgi:hypothetical protein
VSNYTYPFTPGPTVNIAVSGSSAAVALTGGSGQDKTVMVTNSGTAIAFIGFGASTVTATLAASTPVLPGAIYTFSVGQSVTHAAAIGTTGTVYFTTGHGA